MCNSVGVIELRRSGATSIPAEIDHLLKGRTEWDEHFKPRLVYNPEVRAKLSDKALKTLDNPQREDWIGLFCGSLFGNIRNWIGVTGSAYIYADDEALFAEMIDTVAELSYLGSEEMIRQTINFDFGHFWEDICFNNGPLISPKVFRQYVGHHYKRITALLNKHGIDLVSSYCA